MYNKVELCGVNTAELPILSEQEKRDLLTRARAGDKEARQSMIEGNLRLVLSVVQRFSQRGENMDDLFQVGCIGLIKAIDHFDPAQPVRFSTYGVPMIIGEIRRYLRDNSSVRVSRSMRDTAYRVLQAKEKFISEHQREPSIEEIAKLLELKREDVVFALDAIVDPVSLYEPVYSDGGDTICVMDQVKDSKNTDEMWVERIALNQAVSRLSDRERKILALRFFQARPRWRSPRDRHLPRRGRAAFFRSSAPTAVIDENGTVVVDFGGQIAVKKVTLVITKTQGGTNSPRCPRWSSSTTWRSASPSPS